MNSHSCKESPHFRVAIVWRRKGVDRQPEGKYNGHAPPDRYQGSFVSQQALVDSESLDSRP